MHAIAIIPSRYASTRFPGKPLIDIAGKSMIQRVYEGVSAVHIFEDVLVATDDEQILDHVHRFGGKAIMTSPSHQSGTERCAEVISGMPSPPDVVINVQGDEPFVAPEHLYKILDCFNNEVVQIASLVKRISDMNTLLNPGIPKVVFNEHLQALYFSRTPIPYLRDKPQSAWLESAAYYKHIGIYGYKTGILRDIVKLPEGRLEQAERLEQLRWLENGYPIQLMETQAESLAIDTPEDVALLLNNMGDNRFPV